MNSSYLIDGIKQIKSWNEANNLKLRSISLGYPIKRQLDPFGDDYKAEELFRKYVNSLAADYGLVNTPLTVDGNSLFGIGIRFHSPLERLS